MYGFQKCLPREVVQYYEPVPARSLFAMASLPHPACVAQYRSENLKASVSLKGSIYMLLGTQLLILHSEFVARRLHYRICLLILEHAHAIV